MAHFQRDGTDIWDFWPDNDENTLYLTGDLSLLDLCQKAWEYFGDRYNVYKVEVTAERIHTHCLGYYAYDPSDYTDFLVLTLKD